MFTNYKMDDAKDNKPMKNKSEFKECYEKLWTESLKSYYCKCDDNDNKILKVLLEYDKIIYDEFIDEIFKEYKDIYISNYLSYYHELFNKMKTNFGKTIYKSIYSKLLDYFQKKKNLDSYISKQNVLENDHRIVTKIIEELQNPKTTNFDDKIMFDEKEIEELENKIANLSREKHKCCQDQILNLKKQLLVVKNETIISFLQKKIVFKIELLNNSTYKERIIEVLKLYKNDLNEQIKYILSKIVSREKIIIEKQKSFHFDNDNNEIIEKMRNGDYIYKKQLEKSDGKKKKKSSKKKSRKKKNN